MPFSSIEEIIKDYKSGKMIIVVDDEDRENEGDLVCAAQHIDPEKINFMAKYGRGLICVPMEKKRLNELGINEMVHSPTDALKTAFTVSVDAKNGTTTGISAYDRAVTIKKLTDPEATPDDFVKPGHVFPLIAREGGVLKRAGHTEAAVDIARLAGFFPAGVICEIMNEDGTMARIPDLLNFSKKHSLKICSIRDLIEFRLNSERLIKRDIETTIPTDLGEFKLILYIFVQSFA